MKYKQDIVFRDNELLHSLKVFLSGSITLWKELWHFLLCCNALLSSNFECTLRSFKVLHVTWGWTRIQLGQRKFICWQAACLSQLLRSNYCSSLSSVPWLFLDQWWDGGCQGTKWERTAKWDLQLLRLAMKQILGHQPLATLLKFTPFYVFLLEVIFLQALEVELANVSCYRNCLTIKANMYLRLTE